MHLFNHGQAADAGTQHAANAVGEFFVQRRASGQTCIGYSLAGSSNTEVNERVHAACFFGTHVGLQIKALDLAGNFAGKGRGVKFGDWSDTRLAREQRVPRLRHRVPHGADATQAGDNYATTCHVNMQSGL